MFLSSLYCCRHCCLVHRISREPEPLPPFLLVRGVHFFPTLLNFCAKDSLLFFSFSSRRFERSFRSYIQIGVLLKREGEKKRSWSKRRWKSRESPRVALIRAPLLIHPDEKQSYFPPQRHDTCQCESGFTDLMRIPIAPVPIYESKITTAPLETFASPRSAD